MKKKVKMRKNKVPNEKLHRKKSKEHKTELLHSIDIDENSTKEITRFSILMNI